MIGRYEQCTAGWGSVPLLHSDDAVGWGHGRNPAWEKGLEILLYITIHCYVTLDLNCYKIV